MKSRISSFNEVELALSKEAAIKEAQRCLQCDLRFKFAPLNLPPEVWVIFDAETLESVSSGPGVFTLADADKTVLVIKGTENLQVTLKEQVSLQPNARFFKIEEDPMYTKRETELLQQYVQDHGKMPGEDELDDLF
jgi:hypothetical protein